MFTEEVQGRIDNVFSDFELIFSFIKVQTKNNNRFDGERALKEIVGIMEKSRDEAIDKIFSNFNKSCD